MEEIREVFSWDTRGVEAGAEKIERSFERVNRAEKENLRGNAGAVELERQQVRAERAISKHLREIEKEEKASLDRRVRATDEAYRRMDRAAELRQRALVNSLRRESGGARSGGGGTGHGGAGGFGPWRYAGDALDAATGSPGWVMRLNMLRHFGPMIGAAGGAAALLGAGGSAQGKVTDATKELQSVMGQTVKNKWTEAFGLSRLITDEVIGGRGSASGIEGMREQRGEIGEGVEKLRKSRGMMSAGFSGVSSFFGGVDRTARSTRVEIEALNQMNALDDKIATKLEAQTAAKREALQVDEHAGRLKEIELEREEKIAAANDAYRKGKIGVAERSALVNAARGDAANEEFQADQAKLAHEREINLARSETYARGRGEDVSSRTAYSRFQQAAAAYDEAPTKQAREKAEQEKNARYQDYVDAKRAEDVHKEELATAREIAELRGGEGERAVASARMELALAEKLLATAQERGVDAEREARVVLEQKKQALALTEREQAIRASGRASAVRGGEIGLGGAALRAGLAGDLYGPNQEKRFSAGQTVARNDAAAQVALAKEALDAAARKVALEKQSAESLHEQELAQQNLTRATLQQAETEKRLQVEKAEHVRQLRVQQLAMKNETGAMRLDAAGRSDLAGLKRGRDSSAAAATEARVAGRPEIAAEIEAQQQVREHEFYGEKFLRPDGRRLPHGQVLKRERVLRRDAARRERAFERFDRGIGGGGGGAPDQKIGDQAIHDTPGSGLHTGGLRTGGLISGGLGGGAYNQSSVFPRKQQPRGEGKSMDEAAKLTAQYTGRMVEILMSRLPETTL